MHLSVWLLSLLSHSSSSYSRLQSRPTLQSSRLRSPAWSIRPTPLQLGNSYSSLRAQTEGHPPTPLPEQVSCRGSSLSEYLLSCPWGGSNFIVRQTDEQTTSHPGPHNTFLRVETFYLSPSFGSLSEIALSQIAGFGANNRQQPRLLSTVANRAKEMRLPGVDDPNWGTAGIWP